MYSNIHDASASISSPSPPPIVTHPNLNALHVSLWNQDHLLSCFVLLCQLDYLLLTPWKINMEPKNGGLEDTLPETNIAPEK